MATKKTHHQMVQEMTDKFLLSVITPEVRAAVDELLASGLGRGEIMAVVKSASRRAGGDDKSFIVLAVDAYLADNKV